MSNVMSISVKIDEVVEQIEKVKVFQDHWKLIGENLTRLRHSLNDSGIKKEESRIIEKTSQIIGMIQELITNDIKDPSEPNKIAYRELESLLLRLQLLLAQTRVTLTDEYQDKADILCDTYREQRFLVQKAQECRIHQRLKEIEQKPARHTLEQLDHLNVIHATTTEAYLRCCIELHNSVPLRSLSGEIIGRIAQSFYGLSSATKIDVQHKWQVSELPLIRPFIQLRPDKTMPFERKESQRLLFGSEVNSLQDLHNKRRMTKDIWQKLISMPYMLSISERNRDIQQEVKIEENIDEENLVRTMRWVVILGDPGSGKTSFARWLVRRFAETFLSKRKKSTGFGLPRIPILIRVREFADALKISSSLTLFDYIGKHTWMGKSMIGDQSISLDILSSALQDYVKHGQAIIILDGLDEISASDQRRKVINTIENFVETYVQTPTGESVFDTLHMNAYPDDPSQSGGNQLIVTGRIMGYYAAPLLGNFAHYIIRPMNMNYIKDFIDYWFYCTHQQIISILSISKANQGKKHSETIQEELQKEENAGLRNLASNPCLLSFICYIAFSQSSDSPLRSHRIELYQDIVDLLLSSWSAKIPTINVSMLIRILGDIAMNIHQNSTSGLIHEDNLQEICIQSIKDFLKQNLCNEKDLSQIENQVTDFVQTCREEVGVFTARGESLYGFHHLTFQEYFICLKLTDVNQLKQKKLAIKGFCLENKAQIIMQSLDHYKSNPNFLVSIALILGKISSCWSSNDFDDFCCELIQIQDEFESVLPIGAFILINFVNDLVHYPSNNILFDALDRLIIAAGQQAWFTICPFLFDRITAALKKLQNSIVLQWIDNFLSRSPPHTIQTISAFCYLLEGKSNEFENVHWLNESSCSKLQSLSALDCKKYQFAIDRLLVKISFFNHYLLSIHPNTLKEFLVTKSFELHLIPAILFPLIITLYGGLKRDGGSVIFDPSYIYRESTTVTPILISILSGINAKNYDHNQINIKENFLNSLLTQIEINDESSEIADLCTATICLWGIDFVKKYEKISSNVAFSTSISRLKYMSMILRQYYFANEENDCFIENETTAFLSRIVKNLRLDHLSKYVFINLLDSLRSGMARLRSSATSMLLSGQSKTDKRVTLYLPNSFRKESSFFKSLLSKDVEIDDDRNSCSLLPYFNRLFWILDYNDEFDTPYRVAVAMDDIPDYLLFCNDEDRLFPLTFLPQHLMNLYYRLLEQQFIVTKFNGTENLSYGHILVECLLILSNVSCDRLSRLSVLIALLPILRMYKLENFGSSLLWTLPKKDSHMLQCFENSKLYPIDEETGLYVEKTENFFPGNDISDDERQTLIKNYIKQEHQRFRKALIENDKGSTTIYAACISLARICRWAPDKKRFHLLGECIRGAMSIEAKLVRLDALSVILLYSHSDFHRIKLTSGRSLQKEIEHQFNEVFPDLPLLLHVAIFIRCLPLLQRHETMENCQKNLLHKLTSADESDRHIVYEALSPYLQFGSFIVPIQPHISPNSIKQDYADYDKMMRSKSLLLQLCLTADPYKNILHGSLPLSVLLSNMYLMELTSELHRFIVTNDQLLNESNTDASIKDDLIILTKLFQTKSSTLTVAQASTITNLLSSKLASNRAKYPKKFWLTFNDELHHLNSVEFKASRLIECWMRWKESKEFSLFAFHAALLLTQSDIWSVEAANIVCDLLCHENDRFRQKAYMVLRSISNHTHRTSSMLGIDVLLTLTKKMAHFQHSSPFAKLTLSRMFDNITIDIQSHLETFLWLERYRIYALTAKKTFSKLNAPAISQFTPYFPSDITMDVSFCGHIRNISGALLRYMCDLIQSNFASFLDIGDDLTSKLVLDSHVRFVVSVLVSMATLSSDDADEMRQLRIDSFITLLETSRNSAIREAAAFALGYTLDQNTYKKLFKKIQVLVKKTANKNSDESERLIGALISSYCYHIAVFELDFDQDDIDLFYQLLKHSSQIIQKSVHIGLARALKENSVLFQMLDFDTTQYYQALIGSTAYFFAYNVQQRCAKNIVEFVEQHPEILSIFVVELYKSIRHFSKDVLYHETTENMFAYGYPQYVQVASLIATRMPATFISYVKDSGYEDDLKRSLFYTSKQHDITRRSACLTILSVFGELTVELCEMFIEAMCYDLHSQKTSYQYLTRINYIKDEDAVRNLLFSYLESKSMNTRYIAAKMFLHFSRPSLIPYDQVRLAFSELMSDSASEEDLWMIEEQEDLRADYLYYYVGSLKDAVYSLLVQYLVGETSRTIERNKFNDVDSDYIQSEKASCLASCLYEEKREEEREFEISDHLQHSEVLNDKENLVSHHSLSPYSASNNDEKALTYKDSQCDNNVQSVEHEEETTDKVLPDSDIKSKVEDEDIRSSVIGIHIYPSLPSSRTSVNKEKKSSFCVVL